MLSKNTLHNLTTWHTPSILFYHYIEYFPNQNMQQVSLVLFYKILRPSYISNFFISSNFESLINFLFFDFHCNADCLGILDSGMVLSSQLLELWNLNLEWKQHPFLSNIKEISSIHFIVNMLLLINGSK